MDVAKFMQFVHTHEHFRDVEAGMLFLEYSRVVQKSPEVAAGDVLHSEVDVL